MIDPTSDVGRVDESEAPECLVCGERIVEDPDHRVVTWVDDGRLEMRHFCGDEHRDDWLAENEIPG